MPSICFFLTPFILATTTIPFQTILMSFQNKNSESSEEQIAQRRYLIVKQWYQFRFLTKCKSRSLVQKDTGVDLAQHQLSLPQAVENDVVSFLMDWPTANLQKTTSWQNINYSRHYQIYRFSAVTASFLRFRQNKKKFT